MTIIFDEPGSRYYEIGVDKVLVHSQTGPGTFAQEPWNGVISIAENPSNTDTFPVFFDSEKIANLHANTDFSISLESFSYPNLITLAQGERSLAPGLFATNQPKTSFGLTWRTMIGNDTEGMVGYKLHFLWGAKAAPSNRRLETKGQEQNPSTFIWEISGLHQTRSGMKPTSHLYVDTRYVDEAKLAVLEERIYTQNSSTNTMPKLYELIATLT